VVKSVLEGSRSPVEFIPPLLRSSLLYVSEQK
jgi:hypothetical protein